MLRYLSFCPEWSNEMSPSAETLHHFLNTLPAVLYEYIQHQDGSGEVKYVSPNSMEILGHPSEYFLKDIENFWKIIHPDDLEIMRREDENTVNDASFSYEVRIVLPSNEVRWVRFVSKPASKATNGDIDWIGCIVDVTSLKVAQEEIRILKGILPICSYCKGIRDDKGYWNQLEKYISEHSDAKFTHGICDKCFNEHFPSIKKRTDK